MWFTFLVHYYISGSHVLVRSLAMHAVLLMVHKVIDDNRAAWSANKLEICMVHVCSYMYIIIVVQQSHSYCIYTQYKMLEGTQGNTIHEFTEIFLHQSHVNAMTTIDKQHIQLAIGMGIRGIPGAGVTFIDSPQNYIIFPIQPQMCPHNSNSICTVPLC